ncbi:transmembrane protein 14C [Orussus abietinus]|uniref:transmembrane protein 14C n=1 Tax=Orussus abietinus TaxID=222816 RepID=UPI000626888D|nr:transmembrane protein 14C [Orussus abietinus]
MPLDLPAFSYAAAIAAGGIIGYVKSNSIPSLGAGLLFGSIIGYGAYQTSQDPSNYGVLLGTSCALGGLMGYRCYSTGKFMPAGMVTLLSVLMITKIVTRNFNSPVARVQ